MSPTKTKAPGRATAAATRQRGATAKPRTKAAKKGTAAAKPRATTAKGSTAAKTPVRAPRTVPEFMALALVMEYEAAQRYAEFADAMEMHNNRDVASLFRKMAEIEGKHAAQIMAEMGWKAVPPLPAGTPTWEGFEAPETTPGDEVHYLMQPYHALQLALQNEQKAERFFARLARTAGTDTVRKAARALQDEEREHVLLVKAWMAKVPKPDADWANDPDPPSYTD
jgi:rubrerythrin